MSVIEYLVDWNSALVFLGIIYFFKILTGLIINLYSGWRSYILPKLFGNSNFPMRFGEWALVTGCTGGIGREYALGLAKKGMKMVLVSRSRQKLEELKKEIINLYKVECIIIVADFTKIEAIDQVLTKLKDTQLDLGILVNNVGILGPHFQPFLELDSNIVREMITVNITVATVLCHELLPAMIRKRKGAVINIASMQSFYPGPYLGEYAATKHYMHALTEAISLELEDSGVIVQEVDPGEVATEMTKHFAPGPLEVVPSAQVYVESALDTLGYSQRTVGYWGHSLQMLIIALIPDLLFKRIWKAGYKMQYEYAIQKLGKTK